MNPNRSQSVAIGEAWEMLMHIPANDRDEWVKIGGVLKDEFGDEAFAIWDEWSQTGTSYNARDAKAVWKSLGKNDKRARIGTLIHVAKRYGWGRTESVQPPLPKPRPAPEPDPVNRSMQTYAGELWLAGNWDDAVISEHPYAKKKGIGWAAGSKRGIATGKVIGRAADCILVPVRERAIGQIQAVQCINADGAKQTFGPIKGGCLVLGNTLDRSIPWYVAEGWASAVSMVFHHHRGNAVCAVAFGKHNMEATAHLLGEVFNPAEVVVLREAD
jgi:putative DNA primase/helicase